MKILVVSQYYYPEEFRINDICEQMVKDGHQVTVLSGIPNYPKGRYFSGYGLLRKRRERKDGVKIVRAIVIPRGRSRLCLALNYVSFVCFGWLQSIALRKEDFDLIFVYGLSPVTMALPAIAVKRHSRAPLILYVLDLWPESVEAAGGISNRAVLHVIGRIVDYIYRSCDRILVSSKSFVKAIADRGHDERRINFWPQYAEDIYISNPNVAEDSVRNDIPRGFNIVFAGNLGEAQGLDVVVHAADLLRSVPQIHWILIGDGRAKPDLERMVKERELTETVKFIPRQPARLMPHYFSLADAALVSLKDDPVFSMTLPAKLQSYMAFGVPILACANGETARTVVEAEAGLTCNAGDFEGLAKIAKRLYDMSEEQRQRFRENSRRFFNENYGRGKLMAGLYSIFNELVNRQHDG